MNTFSFTFHDASSRYLHLILGFTPVFAVPCLASLPLRVRSQLTIQRIDSLSDNGIILDDQPVLLSCGHAILQSSMKALPRRANK